ncbi:MAG: NAD(P)H-dependent oxidoreductase [Planctomycetota bacterium]|nr:NAD(P)H-dependent oxidoreductase [Planctomycetota bacterium]MDA1178662.1 NAD(P)H-dependent oxidoreductase [Planctomycetota bacterium]
MFAIVSCSLNPKSRSRVLGEYLKTCFHELEVPVDWIDLQDMELPWCDGGPCYGHPNVGAVAKRLQAAHGIVLASPVYNYDVNAAAKNLVELTGKDVWTDKCVGFVCAAGGKVSYMATMGLANSLMLDFHSLILPRFVFAMSTAFNEQRQLVDQDIQERLKKLAHRMVHITRAMRSSE